MIAAQTASSEVSLTSEINKVILLKCQDSFHPQNLSHSPVGVVVVDDEEAEAPVLVDPGQLVGGGRVLGLGDNLSRWWRWNHWRTVISILLKVPVIIRTLCPKTRPFSRLAPWVARLGLRSSSSSAFPWPRNLTGTSRWASLRQSKVDTLYLCPTHSSHHWHWPIPDPGVPTSLGLVAALPPRSPLWYLKSLFSYCFLVYISSLTCFWWAPEVRSPPGLFYRVCHRMGRRHSHSRAWTKEIIMTHNWQ